MKTAISCFFIIAFASFLIVACKKDSQPPPAPPPPPPSTGAVFIIIDSSCGVNVSGNFQSGLATTSGEKIAVKLNVSDTGMWHLTSDTLNGVYFSGSGVFLDTGEHVVELPAFGTAILPGNYRFTLNHVPENTFVISILEDPGPIESVPDSVYFKATINNQDITSIVTQAVGYYLGGLSANGHDSSVVGAAIATHIFPSPPGTGTISFQIGYFDDFPKASNDAFKDFLKPGSYPIAWKTCDGSLTTGPSFAWNDSSNRFWETYHYGDREDGSYFKIVGAKDGYDSTGKYFVKVKMRFKCKLYNNDTGEMIELTNGEMVVPLIKYD